MKMTDAVRLVLTTPLSDRDIATALSMSKTTIGRYRRIAASRSYRWTELSTLPPRALRLKFNRENRGPSRKRVPDYEVVRKELETKHITLQLLWEEYRAVSPLDALSYAQFTARYRDFLGRLPSSMRQHHPAGERVFVDYSGKKAHYVDPDTGEKVYVEVFVAVLGASDYLYATCTHSQTIPDWLHANVGMLDFFGGVPAVVVPDNLKSAVIKTGKTPTLQRSYLDFARHYGLTVLPARPYKPKDKAKVEGGVKLVQRWVIPRLRHHTFYSLDELNTAVADMVVAFNERAFKKLPGVPSRGSRRSAFETIDRPALNPLPAVPYEYAEWLVKQTVPKDYHLAVQGHFYSVPHAFVGQTVDVRITRDAVEFFVNSTSVSKHARSPLLTGHTTVPDHQPPEHRAYAGRTPEAMCAWAKRVGPATAQVVEAQFARAKPVLGLPACSSLKRLAEQHGEKTLESAARRAVDLRSLTLTSVKSILRNGLHASAAASAVPSGAHARGGAYYKEDRPC